MSSSRSAAPKSSGVATLPPSSPPSSRSRTTTATPTPASSSAANAAPSPPAASAPSFAAGGVNGGATPDAKLFVDAFLPLALKTPHARTLRKEQWTKQLDTSGRHRVSPGAVEGWVQRTLRAHVKKDSANSSSAAATAARLFKKYKPSYVHAYNASVASASTDNAHDHDDDATIGSITTASSTRSPSTPRQHHSRRGHKSGGGAGYVSHREFRLLAGNLCFDASAYDAFSVLDVDKTNRITRYDFVQNVGKLKHHGFEALALVGSGGGDDVDASDGGFWEPDAVFDRMDADHGGMVLFGEWAAFLRAAEIESAALRQEQQEGEEEGVDATSPSGESSAGAGAAPGFWGQLLALPSDFLAARSAAHRSHYTPGSHRSDDGASVHSGFSLLSTPSLATPSLTSPRSARASRVPKPRGATRGVPSSPSRPSPFRSPRARNVPQSVVDNASTSALHGEVEALRRELESARSDAAERAIEAEDLATEVDEARARDEERSAEMESLRYDLAAARGALEVETEVTTNLEEARTASFKAEEAANARCDSVRQELESAREELSRLEFSCEEREVRSDEETGRMKASIAAKENENEALLQKVEQIGRELEECRSERDDWRAKLHDEAKSRREEVELLKEELDESKRGNEKKQQSNEALQRDVKEVRGELEECRSERDGWRTEAEQHKAELNESKRNNEGKDKIIEALQEDVDEVRSELEECRSDLEECRSEKDGWKAKLNDEAEARREEVERLQAASDESKRSSSVKEEQNTTLLLDVDKVRGELEESRSERDDLKVKLKDEAEARREEVERLQAELAESKQSNEVKEEQNTALLQDVDKVRRELEESRSELDNWKAKLNVDKEAGREEAERRQAELAESKRVNEAKQEKNKALLRDAEELMRELDECWAERDGWRAKLDVEKEARQKEAERHTAELNESNQINETREEQNNALLQDVEKVREELEECRSKRDDWKAKLNGEALARQTEVGRLKDELNELKRSNAVKEEQNNAVIQDVEKVRWELEESRSERDGWKAKLNGETSVRQTEVGRLNDELNMLKRSNEAKEEQNKALSQDIDKVQRELGECRSERDGLKAIMSEEQMAKRAEMERLEEKLSESKRSNELKEEQNKALVQDVDKVRGELEKSRSERDCWTAKLNSETSAQQTEMEVLKDELTELKRCDEVKEDQNKGFQQDLDKVRRDLEECRIERDGWKAKLTDETSTRQTEVKRLKAELNESKRSNEVKEKKNKAFLWGADKIRRELEECKSERDGWKAKLKDESSAWQTEAGRLKTELNESRRINEEARSAEIGNNNNKSRSLDFGDNDGNSTQRNKRGNCRAFFVFILGFLLAAVCGFFLCSRTVCSSTASASVDETINTAAAETATDSCPSTENLTDTIFTLEGALHRMKEECDAKSLECEAEISRLRSSHQSCLDEIGGCRDTADECRKELEVQKKARGGMDSSLDSARLSLDGCRGSLEANEASISALQDDYDKLSSQYDEIRDSRNAADECQREIEVLNGARHDMESSVGSARLSLDKCQRELEVLKGARGGMDSSLDSARLSLDGCRGSLEANEASISALQDDFDKLSSQYDEIRDSRDAADECQREIEVLNGVRHDMESSLGSARLSLDKCQRELEVSKDTRGSMESNLDSARLSLDGCRASLEAREASISALQHDYDISTSKCDADVSNWKREVQTVGDAKRAAENAGQARYDELMEDYNLLMQESEVSKQQELEKTDFHSRYEKLSAATHQKLHGMHDKVKNALNGMRKGQNGTDKFDWTSVFDILGMIR